MAGRPRFLCGVVEGFYGRPWSVEQRKLLFQWLKRRELNCYMYAPKDELKHRLLWREPYTEHEAARMRSLIKAAQEQGVEFVFAISAGQDMVFSSAGDRLLLQQKLRQVAAMGCHSFALLFDDIDPCMCQADRDVFPSLAQAQASVANEAYQELGQPSIFLFCPTEYCSSLCSPSPSQSCYLLTLGQELLPGIGVIWTGPKVVSQELSATLLEEVEGVLRRRPVIWDNLYANDYDCRRVFLGPYTGRAPGLMSRLCGLLLNPNCELQANFIPIHTLGSWFQSELGSCARPDRAGMEITVALRDSQGPQKGAYSPQEDTYSPQEALELALLDWVAEINQQALEPGGRAPGHPSISLKGGTRLQPGSGGQQAGSGPTEPLTAKEARSSPTAPVTPEEARSTPMAPVTPEEARSSPTALVTPEEARSCPTALMTPEEARSNPTAPLTLEEVRMLVELFYLPYHHGSQAQHLLEHFRWLWANSLSVGVPAAADDASGGTRWRGRAQSFQRLCVQICRLHSRLVSSAGRALLYDLHRYLWDIRNVLLAASAFVLWLDGHLLCDPDPKGTWGSCFGWCKSITAPTLLGRDAEPWARRGGLFGELQALLPVGNSCDLFYHPPPLFPSSQLYLLRPLLPPDKAELYRMCRESLDCDPRVAEILVAHPDLLGDRLLGSFLSLSPEYTFVLEDEGGPCGYAAGALCAEDFLQQRDSNWLPATRHKYPRDLGAGTPAPGQDALEEALLFFHTEPLAVPLPVLRRFPSLVQLGTAPRVQDVGASRSLAICLLSALRANGSRGVFCQVLVCRSATLVPHPAAAVTTGRLT
ncbi:protein O-GlcNAcase-like [Patagioenas fasciata monilis]|uniref:protein O-GlcNAcase n=1 Tax=Patagioenas fasciata monilis TaxID=372326 RepID=A0A1V4KA33_PATFA|nr:protein O-GlcNAcase-like [Patagioenas fasciata monilis]